MYKGITMLTLAAEGITKCYGILILEDEEYEVEVNQKSIPEEIMEHLKDWYNRYYMYTGMSRKDIESYKDETGLLDIEGIEILNRIIKSNIFENVNIFRYFSRGKDEILFEQKVVRGKLFTAQIKFQTRRKHY